MADVSVASLLESLREGGILQPRQLDELAGATRSDLTDLRALSRALVRRGWLTPYQAEQLVQGQVRDLVLGPYVLLDRLGAGGMGQVFKARHRLMDRLVALKVIRKDLLASPEAVGRFRREIQAVARLSHPNIVTAHDAAQVGDTHFYVMEHVDGIDLGRLVKERGPLPVSRACECARQAALGLQHASERGLVHRDVKPSNLILVRGDAAAGGATTASARPAPFVGSQIKILDLGLARGPQAGDDELTREGAVMGTPDYMAPEQALDSHRVDVRADVYSLGCTLYHLLTGKPPFPGGSFAEKLVKHQEIDPAPVEALRPEVPPGLGAVVRKMMAKSPRDRYQTPADAATALKPFCTRKPDQPWTWSGGAPASPAGAGPVLGLLETSGVKETAKQPVSPPAPRPATRRPQSVAAEAPKARGKRAACVPDERGRNRTFLLLAVGALVLAGGAVLLGQLLIRIRDPQGRESEVRAPAGSKVGIGPGGQVDDVTLPPPALTPVAQAVAPVTPPGPRGELIFEDTFADDPKRQRPSVSGDAQHRSGVQDGRSFTEIFKGTLPGTGIIDRFPVAAYDFVAEMRLHFTGGMCLVTFRVLGDRQRSLLVFNVHPDGSWILKRQYAEVSGNSWTRKREEVLAQQRPGAPLFKENQWTDLKIEACGEIVEIQANGHLLLRVTDVVKPDADRQPTTPGLHVGIAAVSEAPARLEVDHVRVWQLGAPALPTAPPSAPTGELIFEETYDNHPSRSAKEAGWQWENKDGKHTIEVVPGNRAGFFKPYGNAVADFVAEARLNFHAGRCSVAFRNMEDNDQRSQLTLLIEPNGNWYLLREFGQPRVEGTWVSRRETLHSARERPTRLIKEKQWTDLRVEARGDKITLYANGQLLVEVVDAFRPPPTMKPAQPGLLIGIFGAPDATARLEIDHVRIWRISAAGPTSRTGGTSP